MSTTSTICTKCGAARDEEESSLCEKCGHLSKSSYILDPTASIMYKGFKIIYREDVNKQYYIETGPDLTTTSRIYLNKDAILEENCKKAWYKSFTVAKTTIDKYYNQEQLDVKPLVWQQSIIRRFEYKKGTSDKWYEIYWGQNINTDINKRWFYLARYGRSGYDGMMQQKWFSSWVVACSSAERKIKEKLSKGYKEVGVALAAVQSSITSVVVKPPKKLAAQPPEVELLHELLGDNDIAL